MTLLDSFSFFGTSASTRIRRAARGLALAAVVVTAVGVFGAGMSSPALAQAEPTTKQIYDTAAAGKLPEAQAMVQQVLVAHPTSAKAHFLQAELFSRQGNLPRAREALTEAERLAPGLPFVKPEAVQSLRQQLEARPAAATGGTKALNVPQTRRESATVLNAPTPSGSSFPSGLGLALGGAAVAAAIYFGLRKKATPAPGASGATFRNAVPDQNFGATSAAAGGAASGLSGPQSFGNGGATSPSPYGQNYAQPAQAGYGQAGYGQPGQPPAGGMMSGMGGRVAGGLATGLAVGAGVMAAQAIGRSFSGNDTAGHGDRAAGGNANGGNASPGSLAGEAGNPMGSDRDGGVNRDMGGQNFGFNDAAGSSWDDAGSSDSFSADAGGGGDWDT